jgi:ferredoxin-type protein NapH
MSRLSNLTLLPALMALMLLVLSNSTGSILQANAAEAVSENFSDLINALDTPLPCYGPCVISNISSTNVTIGAEVTVKGKICPPANNATIRIVFTRPNYSWIDQYVSTDNVTGEFNFTQKVDMAGFWNIFPVYGHINDRLYVNVTDPNADPLATPPLPPKLPGFKPNYTVIALAVTAIGTAVVAAGVGTRGKTRKISSLRLVVQILIIFVLFFGILIDHQNTPWPAEQLAPHEFLIGTSSLGVLPDGLPIPALSCWYPCGRTLTCPLWQLQTYIYPFSDVGRGWGVNYDISGLARIALVFGIVVVAAVLLGRFWCGWICPFGLYMDLITKLRKTLKIKHRDFSPNFNEKFHQLSYIILAIIIIISVIFASEALTGTQLIPGTQTGGFVYTYFSAPFCQVCPMKPLCLLIQVGAGVMKPEWVFGTTTGQFLQLGQYITSLNLFVLGLVTVAAFFFRRSWCRICPLGGLIALFNRFPPFKWISGVRLEKAEEKCTKCGVCKRVCPTQVTEVYEAKGGDVTTSQCLLCLRCVEMCPEKDCLKFKVAGKAVCKSRNWLEKP